MPEEIEGTTPAPAGPDGGNDAEYWKNEAQKAFAARDRVKREFLSLKESGLNSDQQAEYTRLKESESKAEEDRKRKAGEFDAWRVDISKKHADEVATRDAKLAAAEQKYRSKLVSAAFAGAHGLFGKDGKTVLLPDVAEAYFGRHVDVDTVDTDDGPVERLVVKDRAGHVILDTKTGRPADFEQALTELIDGLPQRANLLRGSGKTGSGSSGGAQGTPAGIDLNRLTPEQFSDPRVRAAVKANQAKSGGLQMGRAWDKKPA